MGKRQRFRVLEFWRNERVVYGRRASAKFEAIVDVLVRPLRYESVDSLFCSSSLFGGVPSSAACPVDTGRSSHHLGEPLPACPTLPPVNDLPLFYTAIPPRFTLYPPPLHSRFIESCCVSSQVQPREETPPHFRRQRARAAAKGSSLVPTATDNEVDNEVDNEADATPGGRSNAARKQKKQKS